MRDHAPERHCEAMSTNDTQILEPPTPATPPPLATVPPLRRSTTDRMIGGVCGGMGRRYGIDPLVLRVLFVVGVLASGVGLLVYLALWLLLPSDRDVTPGLVTRSFLPLVVGVLLGLGALAALIGWFGSLGGLAGVVVGAFLVGLAVWVYQNRDTLAPARTWTPDAATPGGAVDPSGNPPTGFAYGGTGYPAGTQPFTPPPPAPPRSYLGLITLCAALAVGAGLAAASAAGISPIGITGGLAAMLAVLAAGMLVGAFRGRAKWLVIFALPLALMLGVVGQVASLAPSSWSANAGTPTWTPTEPTVFSLGIGEAVLDLRPWAKQPGAAPTLADTVTATANLGRIEVIVPDTWRVDLTADARAGEITVNGDRIRSDSPTVRYEDVLTPRGDAAGAMTLVLSVGVGEIDIRQRPVDGLGVPGDGPIQQRDKGRDSQGTTRPEARTKDRSNDRTNKENDR